MLAFIVGLKAEAALIAPLEHAVFIGGGGAIGAATATAAAIAAGARALVSFGLAGGLDPALRPGHLIVPHEIIGHGSRYAADPDLSRALGGFTAGALLGAAQIAASADEKARLFTATGAAAVDLESGAVAEAAAGAALPFAALRAVCDPARRDLPPAALVALDQAGAIGLGRVLRSLAREPSQLGALLAVGRDAARARHALAARVADLLRVNAAGANSGGGKTFQRWDISVPPG
jgi:adenosylhomocysteine nucleosidase